MLLIKKNATARPETDEETANQTLESTRETAIMGDDMEEKSDERSEQIIQTKPSGNGKDSPVSESRPVVEKETVAVRIVPRVLPGQFSAISRRFVEVRRQRWRRLYQKSVAEVLY